MKRVFFVFIVVTLLLVGCASANQISRLASSRVLPCASEDIVVSNIKAQFPSLIKTWDATCQGRVYRCSGRSDGHGNNTDVSCSPATAKQENEKTVKKLRPPHK